QLVQRMRDMPDRVAGHLFAPGVVPVGAGKALQQAPDIGLARRQQRGVAMPGCNDQGRGSAVAHEWSFAPVAA
ncbi:MAG: hypothetical protein ACK56I_04090, partial [bacterium]